MVTSFNRFVVTQALVIASFNAGINSFYTWWLWSSRDVLPLSGADSPSFGNENVLFCAICYAAALGLISTAPYTRLHSEAEYFGGVWHCLIHLDALFVALTAHRPEPSQAIWLSCIGAIATMAGTLPRVVRTRHALVVRINCCR